MPTPVDELIDLEEPVANVIVLSRADFEDNLRNAFGDDNGEAAGAPVDEITAVRAAELAGLANQPAVIGMAARRTRGTGRRFAGNVFVIADTVETDPRGDRIVVTSFDVVAVELSGTASWIGINVRRATGSAPVGGGGGDPRSPQPGRCCGPRTICVPEPGGDDPPGPPYRYSMTKRVAVSGAIGPPGVPGVPGGGGEFDTAGDYHTRAGRGRTPVRLVLVDDRTPAGLPPLGGPPGVPGSSVLDCVAVLDKTCTHLRQDCTPVDIGFTRNDDGGASVAVGSNPCGAPNERPVRTSDVPEICTVIFGPENLPEQCGGKGGSLGMPWETVSLLPKLCAAAHVAPGTTGPCNPKSQAQLDGELKLKTGWSPGKATRSCEPLAKGGEYCVECDAQGNCSEQLDVPRVDPKIAGEAPEQGGDVTDGTGGLTPADVYPDTPADPTEPTRKPLVHTEPASATPPGPKEAPAARQREPVVPNPLVPGPKPSDVVAKPTAVADPVDLSDGALRIDHVDLSFPGPVRGFEFSRTYTSTSGTRSALGSNWTHGWDERLEPLRPDTAPEWLSPWAAGGNALTTAVLHHRGDGGADLYLYDAMTSLYLPHAGSVSTLARTGDGWALRDPDGRIRVFDELGYLTQDRDRFGNQFTLDYEPTPLGRLFENHCAPARLAARNETLHHRRNVLLAYLVGAGARPSTDASSWTVAASDFDPPFDEWPSSAGARGELAYARDYLLHLGSLGAIPESVDGARRRRLRAVTDPVGRQLRFSYVDATSWDPHAPSPVAFAAHPDAGLLRRVDGPEATTVEFGYGRPPGYPAALNELYLVTVARHDGAPASPALVAASTRSYRFTYNWPAGPVESYPAYVGAVQQAYEAYYKTFVGCAYHDSMGCLSGATFTVPRYNSGDPADLARRAAEAYVSDVADDIVAVSVNGRLESETRYPVDPHHAWFGRVVAQRFGSSTARAPISTVPPDMPGENWASALPKAVLEWVDSGPTQLDATGRAVDERSESALPAAIRDRYPLEPAPAPNPPPAPSNTKPRPGVCNLDATRAKAQVLPGWRPTVAYYDPPAERRQRVAPVSELRRTWLTRDQLIAAQVGDPTHNDLSYSLAPDPSDTLMVFVSRIVGRRPAIAANANRICRWVKMTDRDALISWRGMNYRGQQLVLAEVDFTGSYRFSEWRYNADGKVVEHRPAALAGARAARTISWTYDEIDPTAQRGWNEFLPAFWARRQNLLRTEVSVSGTLPDDDLETGQPTASATSPLSAPTGGRYRTTSWDPLFNQPLRSESGSIRVSGTLGRQRRKDVPHQHVDHIYDYQELSLEVPDDDPGSLSGVLEALRGWGFAWLRNDPEAIAWQLPVALLGIDINGDGALGNRFASSAPAAGPPLDPEVVAARRAVGAAVVSITSRPGEADSRRVWLYSWAPHGLPSRVVGPDGAVVRNEYYPVDAAFGDPDQLSPPIANAGYCGMLARTITRTHRPGSPAIGPKVTTGPLDGPYRWLPVSGLAPTSTAADVQSALEAVALPEEMVDDLLATLTFDAAVEPVGARAIVTHAYNPAGHLASTKSATGVASQVTDTDGRPVSARDAVGTTATVRWDAFGNAVAGNAAGAAGRVAEWAAEYDEEDRPIYHCQAVGAGGATNPANGQGLVQRWEYFPEGGLAAHTDPAGVVTEHELDGWGRAISQTLLAAGTAERRLSAWTLDVGDRPTALRLGGTPGAGQPNLTESWTHDGLGRLVNHTDRRGTEWQFAWSARGAGVRKALAPLPGQSPDWEEITAFDDTGLPTSTTVVGRSAGSAQAPRSLTAVREWTPGGQLCAQALDGYAAARFAPDLTGRVVWEQRPDGVQIVRTYSQAPNRMCEAELWAAADGTRRCRATIADLDPRGLPIVITHTARDAGQPDPAHRIRSQREYDAMGRLVVEIGPLAERTESSWDWAGRKTQEREERSPGGPMDTTFFTWTPDDQLATQTDPDGQLTVVTHNPLSEVIGVSIAGFRRSNTRDRLGRISTVSDGVSTLRTVYGDTPGGPLGDPVLEELQTAGGWEASTVRGFDEFGRIVSVEARNLGLGALAEADRTVRTEREYDHLGRITREVSNVGTSPPLVARAFWSNQPTGGWERQRTLDCAAVTSALTDLLDGARRLTSRSANGSAPVTFDWEGQTYRGRRQPQPGWASQFIEAIQLDPFGLPMTTTWRAIELDKNGAPVSAADAARWAPPGSDQILLASPLLECAQARDPLGRSVSQWSRTATPATGARTRWQGAAYDGRRRLEQVWEADTLSAPPALATYAAEVSAVAAAAPPGTQPWDYGREPISGDLESIKDGNASRFGLSAPRSSGHRLTAFEIEADTVKVGHDNAARVTSVADQAGSQTLQWHPGSQLAAVEHDGKQVAGFLYDGFDRLVGVIDNGQGRASRLHGFDGDDLIAAYDGAGVMQWEAVRGPAGVIEVRDAVAATSALPLLDDLGSPVAVWQPSTATLTSAMTWTPEGRATVMAPDGSVQCSPDGPGTLCPIANEIQFGFAGAWQSHTTGLVWMRARWYSPALTQFLSPDPLGFVDGVNLYAYAADDPINRVDPLGLQSKSLAKSSKRDGGGRKSPGAEPPGGLGNPLDMGMLGISSWTRLMYIIAELMRAKEVSPKSRVPKERDPIVDQRNSRRPRPPLTGPGPPPGPPDDDDKGPPGGASHGDAPAPSPPPTPPAPSSPRRELDAATVAIAAVSAIGTVLTLILLRGVAVGSQPAPAGGLIFTGPSGQRDPYDDLL